MPAVWPLGPQYSLIFAWHELGSHVRGEGLQKKPPVGHFKDPTFLGLKFDSAFHEVIYQLF